MLRTLVGAARRVRGAQISAAQRARCMSGTPSVAQVFQSMDYGPAPEDDSQLKAWLATHQNDFGLFINGKWQEPADRPRSDAFAPATNELLARSIDGSTQDVDAAVAAARAAFPEWSGLSGHARARHLYSIARHLQKQHRLIAVVEAMDNGKTIRETRDADVPLGIRHFYNLAGWAQLQDAEFGDSWSPVGVCAQVVPWNFPFLMLCWKIAPAIAMGNTVVLKPAPDTRLSAMLFCDILAEAGLPAGVVNVVTGDNEMASHLVNHPDVDKVAFTGSTGVGKLLREQTAGSGKKLTLELGGKSPVLVYESADLDSAVEGIVDAIWFNQGQVCCAGSRILVQESVHEQFTLKLKARMETLRVGHSLDKCLDMSTLVSPTQHKRVSAMVEAGRAEGSDVFQVGSPSDSDGCYYPPTLVTNVEATSLLVQEEVFGPVATVQTFRTPAEAIALANNSKYGLGASVWSENLPLALDAAVSIKAGSVWVNCHNVFDAAAGFGGYKQSGYGREGGREGLYSYLKPSWQADAHREHPQEGSTDAWGSQAAEHSIVSKAGSFTAVTEAGLPAIDRSPKMYIGGAQKRPDNSYSRPVLGANGALLSAVGHGSRKDVRDAVEAAHKAAPGWGKRAAHNRAQVCFYIAENLAARQAEFAERIHSMTGGSRSAAEQEVQASISRLFTYAAYADKYGGRVQETTLYGMTAQINEPVGVVGVACPSEFPLLGFVSLVAPAVVRGNAVVAIPSPEHPLAATDLYQVLDTSDLPGGVINIVTGDRDHVAKTLVQHQHVDAVWYFGGAQGSEQVQRISASNMKRTFVDDGYKRDWLCAQQGEGEEFLLEASEVKNIWVPMGVSI
eukprot:TRINITY_DN7259_c0_g1_i3.p1 TRINITY_DN7259_c0_g1~~TRINITY_DN7259_c0_g1_i3.p1  ORF type:complete len:845 (-),score=251.63 TRINITY_DN7259_c0_g1_i3:162-2696(-)